jgi:hypothetical protein
MHDRAPGERRGGDPLVTTAYSGSQPSPIAPVPLSRRALLASGLGLVSAAGPRPSQVVRAQGATPELPSDEAFPAEVQQTWRPQHAP